MNGRNRRVAAREFPLFSTRSSCRAHLRKLKRSGEQDVARDVYQDGSYESRHRALADGVSAPRQRLRGGEPAGGADRPGHSNEAESIGTVSYTHLTLPTKA